MVKTFFCLVLFALIVFSSGCIKSNEVGDVFVGGTDALKLSFLNLPDIIYPNAAFPLQVLVQNAGEADIFAGKARFVLNNADIFNISSAQAGASSEPQNVKYNSKNLTATKLIERTAISPGQEVLTWQDAKYVSLQPLTEKQKVALAVDACYTYQTKAVAKVCISTDDRTCEPRGTKPIGSSSGPIQITELKQIARPDGAGIALTLTMTVEDKGKGEIYDPTTNCTNLNIEDQNEFNLTNLTIGRKSYSVPDLYNFCDGLTKSLFDKKGTIKCDFDLPLTDFETELTLALKYIYKQRLTTELTVIPI